MLGFAPEKNHLRCQLTECFLIRLPSGPLSLDQGRASVYLNRCRGPHPRLLMFPPRVQGCGSSKHILYSLTGEPRLIKGAEGLDPSEVPDPCDRPSPSHWFLFSDSFVCSRRPSLSSISMTSEASSFSGKAAADRAQLGRRVARLHAEKRAPVRTAWTPPLEENGCPPCISGVSGRHSGTNNPKENNVELLRKYFQTVPPGGIDYPRSLEPRLAACWEELGGDEGGMRGEKLRGRMESVAWNPPRLSFVVERHGGTILGSSRAELQHWRVDVEAQTATLGKVGHRQIERMKPRLDVKRLVDESRPVGICLTISLDMEFTLAIISHPSPSSPPSSGTSLPCRYQ